MIRSEICQELNEKKCFSWFCQKHVFSPKNEDFQNLKVRFWTGHLGTSNKTIRSEIGPKLREREHFISFWTKNTFFTQKYWHFHKSKKQVLCGWVRRTKQSNQKSNRSRNEREEAFSFFLTKKTHFSPKKYFFPQIQGKGLVPCVKTH